MGVVLIPVRTSQLYQQLLARRVVAGQLPRPARPGGAPSHPFVLLSGRLPEVRAFSDFFREFTLQVRHAYICVCMYRGGEEEGVKEEGGCLLWAETV